MDCQPAHSRMFRSTIITKLTYSAWAWLGLCSASDCAHSYGEPSDMDTVLKTLQQLVYCFLQQMNLCSSVSSKTNYTYYSRYYLLKPVSVTTYVLVIIIDKLLKHLLMSMTHVLSLVCSTLTYVNCYHSLSLYCSVADRRDTPMEVLSIIDPDPDPLSVVAIYILLYRYTNIHTYVYIPAPCTVDFYGTADRHDSTATSSGGRWYLSIQIQVYIPNTKPITRTGNGISITLVI